ncbi:MAG: ATP-binding cassette domain-containing protein [Thiobacillus sp.]|uniref:ATP-binding cassette domain-containing protein n=1 Tax=Thiobacillus sp. TaxID=924 RepID=UPI0028938CB3|nr:ATP-binding cassette domain-containing protein [Thiobacillus sp.]MDT3706228.1 ATP-binding cassette domain-containing protein [Thiobacillus sp.]
MNASVADWVIEVEGLGRRFGQRTVLDGLDLKIQRGEVFGLLGSDGAGKTTTLQMLAGILDPSAGRAKVLGYDSAREAAQITARIGYMSQRFSLYGRLTVDENLDFFAALHHVPEAARAERKARLLAFAHLEQHRDRLARFLSGGMQKKLALCCALIHVPPLLILDEPTTGVDPVSRRGFWSILYQALTGGTTIVVSTPYMDEAERCTRVALLHEGRLIACDAPGRLRAEMPGKMVELDARPQRRALAVLQRALPQAAPYVFGERLHLRMPEGDGDKQEWRAALAHEGVQVEAVRAISPSLEDVFVALLPAVPVATPPIALAAGMPANAGGVAVEVQDLSMRFGKFTAVDRVSFTVRRGEIFGFLGPNGSGKTTTIKMLCGLFAPSAGRATVAGVGLGADARALRARIGYMSQRFSLYEDMTVGENLDFFAGVYQVPRDKLAARRDWALQLAGLKGDEGRLTRALSGGLKQRLALACAVLHEPRVLFLDEPTAGVDPLSRRRFWELIGDLAARGVTVFVTTHYMDEAEHCDTLGLLYNGRLIALGSPRELRAGMRAGEMLELECDQPIPALALFGSDPGVQASFFGDRLHLLVDDAAAARPRLLARLEQAGHQVRRIETVPLGIEDVFIAFIQMEQARLDAVDARQGQTG